MTRQEDVERIEAVRGALSTVVDPELGLDIVSLGLVYEVDVVDDRARVTFTLTSMGCPVGPLIEHEIREATLEVDGVERVDTELVFDPPWSPDRLGDDARLVFGYGL